MTDCVAFELYYEYINDEDMANAMACEKRWRAKVEARQERDFRRIIARLLATVGVRRFL